MMNSLSQSRFLSKKTSLLSSSKSSSIRTPSSSGYSSPTSSYNSNNNSNNSSRSCSRRTSLGASSNTLWGKEIQADEKGSWGQFIDFDMQSWAMRIFTTKNRKQETGLVSSYAMCWIDEQEHWERERGKMIRFGTKFSWSKKKEKIFGLLWRHKYTFLFLTLYKRNQLGDDD